MYVSCESPLGHIRLALTCGFMNHALKIAMGLVPRPGPRCHRILVVLGRHPPVEREPQPATTRLGRWAAPSALRPGQQPIPARALGLLHLDLAVLP